MTSPGDLWSGFTHDPRDPANTALRASDRDRDVVHQLLAEAYADGRLDRAEFDLRTEQTGSARTLGELPAIVGDLVATSTTGSVSRVPSDRLPLQEQADRKFRKDLADAVGTFLFPSIVCTVIWALTMAGGFFWPGIVMAVTGARLLRTLFARQATIDAEVRRLEEKQAGDRAKELGEKPAEDDE